jgi:hypothetical protein
MAKQIDRRHRFDAGGKSREEPPKVGTAAAEADAVVMEPGAFAAGQSSQTISRTP